MATANCQGHEIFRFLLCGRLFGSHPARVANLVKVSHCQASGHPANALASPLMAQSGIAKTFGAVHVPPIRSHSSLR